MQKTSKAVGDVLRSVPLGKEARSKELGPVNGNAALGGYDCVIVSIQNFVTLPVSPLDGLDFVQLN